MFTFFLLLNLVISKLKNSEKITTEVSKYMDREYEKYFFKSSIITEVQIQYEEVKSKIKSEVNILITENKEEKVIVDELEKKSENEIKKIVQENSGKLLEKKLDFMEASSELNEYMDSEYSKIEFNCNAHKVGPKMRQINKMAKMRHENKFNDEKEDKENILEEVKKFWDKKFEVIVKKHTIKTSSLLLIVFGAFVGIGSIAVLAVYLSIKYVNDNDYQLREEDEEMDSARRDNGYNYLME